MIRDLINVISVELLWEDGKILETLCNIKTIIGVNIKRRNLRQCRITLPHVCNMGRNKAQTGSAGHMQAVYRSWM